MVQSPHDALFKKTFSQVRHARPLLRSALPRDVAKKIRWSTLQLRPGSFVDEALNDSHTDLLFSARMRDAEVLLYVLFEHQSTFDPWMPLRLLEYMCRIWRAYLLANARADRLPFVLPVVLHHSESGWTAEPRFESLFGRGEEIPAELLRYTPRFELALDDLSHVSDEALRSRAVTALGKLVLACLRYARDVRTLLAGLRAWKEIFHQVREAPHGIHAIKAVMTYILVVDRELGPEKIRALVDEAGDPTLTEDIMTTAELLLEEGRRDGLAKGIEKGIAEGIAKGIAKGIEKGIATGIATGRAEMLIRQLRFKFGRVPVRVSSRVKAADVATLDRWAERVLIASTLDDVFEG